MSRTASIEAKRVCSDSFATHNKYVTASLILEKLIIIKLKLKSGLKTSKVLLLSVIQTFTNSSCISFNASEQAKSFSFLQKVGLGSAIFLCSCTIFKLSSKPLPLSMAMR